MMPCPLVPGSTPPDRHMRVYLPATAMSMRVYLQAAAMRRRRRRTLRRRSPARCCNASCARTRSRLRRFSWPQTPPPASTAPHSASREGSSSTCSEAFPFHWHNTAPALRRSHPLPEQEQWLLLPNEAVVVLMRSPPLGSLRTCSEAIPFLTLLSTYSEAPPEWPALFTVFNFVF